MGEPNSEYMEPMLMILPPWPRAAMDLAAGLGAEVGAGDVGVEDGLETRLVDFQGGADFDDAGAVDEDVDVAEFAEQGGEGGVDRFLAGDVERG